MAETEIALRPKGSTDELGWHLLNSMYRQWIKDGQATQAEVTALRQRFSKARRGPQAYELAATQEIFEATIAGQAWEVAIWTF